MITEKWDKIHTILADQNKKLGLKSSSYYIFFFLDLNYFSFMKHLGEYIFAKKNFQLQIFALWYMKIMTDFMIN